VPCRRPGARCANRSNRSARNEPQAGPRTLRVARTIDQSNRPRVPGCGRVGGISPSAPSGVAMSSLLTPQRRLRATFAKPCLPAGPSSPNRGCTKGRPPYRHMPRIRAPTSTRTPSLAGRTANPGAAIGHAVRSNPFSTASTLRRTTSSASGIIGFVQQTLRLLHGSLAHFMSSHSFDISKSIADRALAAAPEG
jgi:hypothetical protein